MSKYRCQLQYCQFTDRRRRSRVRVLCRNRQVAEAINKKYRTDTGDDGGAATFCVSNKMYMRHQRGYNKDVSDGIPTMSVEETQVPAACAYIHAIPSQGKVDVLEHFITSRIPMLLNVVEMSCSKSTEARVNHILEIINVAVKVRQYTALDTSHTNNSRP